MADEYTPLSDWNDRDTVRRYVQGKNLERAIEVFEERGFDIDSLFGDNTMADNDYFLLDNREIVRCYVQEKALKTAVGILKEHGLAPQLSL